MKAECFKTASWVQTMKQSLELNNTYFYYSNLSKSLKITKAILKYLLSIHSVKARGCTQWVHMETIALIASGDGTRFTYTNTAGREHPKASRGSSPPAYRITALKDSSLYRLNASSWLFLCSPVSAVISVSIKYLKRKISKKSHY